MGAPLDGCRGGYLQRLRRRSGFPLIAGPPVLFQRGWEDDHR